MSGESPPACPYNIHECYCQDVLSSSSSHGQDDDDDHDDDDELSTLSPYYSTEEESTSTTSENTANGNRDYASSDDSSSLECDCPDRAHDVNGLGVDLWRYLSWWWWWPSNERLAPTLPRAGGEAHDDLDDNDNYSADIEDGYESDDTAGSDRWTPPAVLSGGLEAEGHRPEELPDCPCPFPEDATVREIQKWLTRSCLPRCRK